MSPSERGLEVHTAAAQVGRSAKREEEGRTIAGQGVDRVHQVINGDDCTRREQGG